MIGYLNGTVLDKTPTEILLDVHGVGYTLSVSLNTSEAIAGAGSNAALFVHTHVREDTLQLFGFADAEERAAFRMLIGVSGIGPKTALGVLSALTPGELRDRVLRGDLAALSTVPGIGRKTAERLVVELREKVLKIGGEAAVSPGVEGQSFNRSEALLALTSLGFTRQAAEAAIRGAVKESNGAEQTVEQLVRAALKHAKN